MNKSPSHSLYLSASKMNALKKSSVVVKEGGGQTPVPDDVEEGRKKRSVSLFTLKMKGQRLKCGPEVKYNTLWTVHVLA